MSLKQQMADSIAKTGMVFVPMIDPAGQTPMVVHTVGLMDKGLPELIIAGPDMKLCSGILAYVAAHLFEHGALPDMGSVPPPTNAPETSPMVLRDVPQEIVAKFPFVALDAYYGEDRPFKLQQVVLFDAHGKMPWDDGYGADTPYEAAVVQRAFWRPGILEMVMPNLTRHAGKKVGDPGIETAGAVKGSELFGEDEEEVCNCPLCTTRRKIESMLPKRHGARTLH